MIDRDQIRQQELDAFRRNILPGYVEFVEKQNEIKRILQPSKPVKKIKPTEQVKRCRICGKFKDLSAFYKSPLKKFGRFDECKQCLKNLRNKNKANILKPAFLHNYYYRYLSNCYKM